MRIEKKIDLRWRFRSYLRQSQCTKTSSRRYRQSSYLSFSDRGNLKKNFSHLVYNLNLQTNIDQHWIIEKMKFFKVRKNYLYYFSSPFLIFTLSTYGSNYEWHRWKFARINFSLFLFSQRSDYHGRKPLLIAPIVGFCFAQVVYIGCYFFVSLNAEFLLLSSISNMFGGFTCLLVRIWWFK